MFHRITLKNKKGEDIFPRIDNNIIIDKDGNMVLRVGSVTAENGGFKGEASSAATLTNLSNSIDELNQMTKANVLSWAYPVGSIYTSVVNTNPSTLFGGTWVLFGAGKTLVGVDANDTSFSTVEKTGGHKELSAHTHSVSITSGNNSVGHTHSVGAHSHGLNGHTHSYAKVNSPTGGPSNNTSGATTLTVAQMPQHNHSFTGKSHKHQPNADGYKFVASTGNVKVNGTKRAWWSNSGTADKCFVYCDAAYEITEPQDTTSVTQGGTIGDKGDSGSHTHSLSSHTHTTSTTATNSGGPSTTNTADSSAFNSGGISANHTHSVSGNTGSTGGGNAGNLQPYITVYFWKRTA